MIHGYLSQGDAGIRVDLRDGYPKGRAGSSMMFVFAFWKKHTIYCALKNPKRNKVRA